MRRVIPYLILVLGIIISTLAWEHIKLAYDQENLIQGEFFTKQYNPKNEIIRFIVFVFFPLILFLFFFIRNGKNFDILPWGNDFFLNRRINQKITEKNLNIVTVFFILFIFIEFLSLNFSNYSSGFDSFHEGTFLVPPVNNLYTDKYWLSTIYDYGLTANNLGLISLKFFDKFSIGTIRIIHLILIFFNKIILILICRKILLNINLKSNLKIIFFIFLSFLTISLSSYNIGAISIFSQRILLFLIFLLFLINVLTEKENVKLNSIILGSFSLTSFMWWIDIGFYTNAVLSILLIYLIFEKEYKNFFYIFFSCFFCWMIFFLIISNNEFNEFLYQTKFVSSVSSYLLGIEFPKPFSEGSTRSTRALLLIIFCGVLLINFLFNRKININYETKITLIFLFLSSIILFNSALMRTDTPHLKYTSGLYTFLIYFFLLFLLFKFIESKKYLVSYITFFSNNKFYIIFFIFFMFVFNILISKNNSIKNIFHFKNNIMELANLNDDVFLSNKTKNFLNRFYDLSKDDKCIQIFTDDISLPYLMNKPTCTQFYIPAHIVLGYTEDRFISQLKNNLPNFIIYSSHINWLTNKKNMPNANNFILEKYSFFEKIHDWEIYKLN